MRYLFVLFVFLLSSSLVSAKDDWQFRPFAGFDAQYGFVKVNSETVNPINSRLRLGSYVYKTVGFEFSYGGIPLHTGEDHGVELSIEQNMAFNLRWESPADKNRGLSAYFLTGYVTNTVQAENFDGTSFDETYQGLNLGLGFKQLYYGHVGVYFEYNYQYFKDDVRISGLAVGMQFEF